MLENHQLSKYLNRASPWKSDSRRGGEEILCSRGTRRPCSQRPTGTYLESDASINNKHLETKFLGRCSELIGYFGTSYNEELCDLYTLHVMSFNLKVKIGW